MNDFLFRGKYATYVKFLADELKTSNGFKLFPTFKEIYMFSGIYGCLNGEYEEYQPNESDSEADESPGTIKSITFINDPFYETFRKLIIINDSYNDTTPKERLDNALRYDYESVNNSKYERNTEIINCYVYGGLSKLYSKTRDLRSSEDAAKMLYDMIDNFADECKIPKEYEE